jgi:YHS domain-containing protein
MKRLAAILSLLAVVALVGSTSAFDDKNPLEGMKCFMMPTKALNPEKSVKYKEGNVYFCCGNCAKKFEGDPEKYATKANQQLVASKQYKQEACPFSGGKLNAETAIDVGGAKVSFCCNNCKGKAEKMKGDEQLEAVFGKAAFEKGKFVKVEAKK